MMRIIIINRRGRSFLKTILRLTTLLIFIGPLFTHGQRTGEFPNYSITEIENGFMKMDPFWRGADGASSIKLSDDRVLWLFSDTFIDQDSTSTRANSRFMIRNSLAIQESTEVGSPLKFYYSGSHQEPSDFFQTGKDTWFWTGHGLILNDKLLIFLMEEKETEIGLGFEAIGWWIALVHNPSDSPDNWKMEYFQGPDYHGVIVGSSAVLQDEEYVYAFGVEEPSTHVTFLLRILKNELLANPSAKWEWWTGHKWKKNKNLGFPLFNSATEFSVHFEETIGKYIQIQSHGFGHASIGYRLAENLMGPWTDPLIIYTPQYRSDAEFMYAAKAHPELSPEGKLIVSYNVNHTDFNELITNEALYFPCFIEIKIQD